MDKTATAESQDGADDDFFQEVQRVCHMRKIAKSMTPLSGLRLMKELAGSLTPSPGPGDQLEHERSIPIRLSLVEQSDVKNKDNVNPSKNSANYVFFNARNEETFQNDQHTAKSPPTPKKSNFRMPLSCLKAPSFPSAAQSTSNPSIQQCTTKGGKSSQIVSSESQRWMREYFREKRLRQKFQKDAKAKDKKYAKLKRKGFQPPLFNLNMASNPDDSEKKSRRKTLTEQVIDCITSPVCIFPLAKKTPNKGSNSEDLFATLENSSLCATSGDKEKHPQVVISEFPPLSDKGWEEISKANTPKFFSVFNRHELNKENSQTRVKQSSALSGTDTSLQTQRDSGIGSEYSQNSATSSLSLCSSNSPSIASSCGPSGEFSWRMGDNTGVGRPFSSFSEPNCLKSYNNSIDMHSNVVSSSKSSQAQMRNAFPPRARHSSNSNTTSKRLPLASVNLPSVPVFIRDINTWSNSEKNYQSRSQPF